MGQPFPSLREVAESLNNDAVELFAHGPAGDAWYEDYGVEALSETYRKVSHELWGAVAGAAGEGRCNDNESLSPSHDGRRLMPKRAGSSTDPKPIAVVGSGGFIGAALTARLTADGVPVRLFTRRLPFLSPSGRLCADAASSQTLVWLASSVNPAIAQQRPDLVEADHASFGEFLRAVRSTTDPPRIVLVSSGGTVYDASAAPPYREDSPTKAANAYGESKLRMERALQESGLSRVVLRVSNAYGPGQPARRGLGVITHWLHAVANGERPVILGAPETARDYVYIDDIVSALVAVHGHPDALPEVLNIGSGVATSLGNLAEIVLKVVGDPALSFDVRPPRSFDVALTWLDVSLARQALAWRPRVPIIDGVGATWGAILASRGVRAHQR